MNPPEAFATMMRLKDEGPAPIVCNQTEYHALLGCSKVADYARFKGIDITVYWPMRRKHGVTPKQIGLQWLLDQDGVAAIPKAAQAASQQANLDAFSVVLDDADQAVIAGLLKGMRLVTPGWAVE